MFTPSEIELFNQKKYENEYSLEQLSINPNLDRNNYFHKLVQIKLGLIQKYGLGKNVLDVGCGAGDYLLQSKNVVSSAVGIDYTQKAITEALRRRNQHEAMHLDFRVENARQMSFSEATFDLAYAFSSLYYMPKVQEVVAQMVRVLRPKGVAIFEMGNTYSLNTIVCNAYPELPQSCHISTGRMAEMIRKASLRVLSWRAFQILPMWGEKPAWLRILLGSRCKKILERNSGSIMLDEKICSVPVMRAFAFRHIIICQKV